MKGVLAVNHSRLAFPTAEVAGFHHAFLAGAILLACGALVVLLFMPQGGFSGHANAVDELAAVA